MTGTHGAAGPSHELDVLAPARLQRVATHEPDEGVPANQVLERDGLHRVEHGLVEEDARARLATPLETRARSRIEAPHRCHAHRVEQVSRHIQQHELRGRVAELDDVRDLLPGHVTDRPRLDGVRSERQPWQHELAARVGARLAESAQQGNARAFDRLPVERAHDSAQFAHAAFDDALLARATGRRAESGPRTSACDGPT